MKKNLFKYSALAFIILLEVFTLLYLKADTGAYFIADPSQSLSQHLSQYGSSQFFIATHVQRVVLYALLAYMLIIGVLLSKEYQSLLFIGLLATNHITKHNVILHIISFFLLAISCFVIISPQDIAQQAQIGKSILYTAIPIVWLVYLYTVINLLLPPKKLFQLMRGNVLIAVCICFVVSLMFNDKTHVALITFWSDLLLRSTIGLSTAISHLIGFQAGVLPNNTDGLPVFGTAKFHVEIAPPCSGFEGMSLVIFSLALYCFLQRSNLQLGRALLFIPVATAAMYVLNAVRIVALVAIGHYWSPEIAIKGFHSVAGWLNFLVVLIASIYTLNEYPCFSRPNRTHQASATPKSDQDWNQVALLLPLMALIACGLVVKGLTADFAWLYPIHICAAALVLYFFRGLYLPVLLRPSALSVVIGILVFTIWVAIIPEDSVVSAHFFAELQHAPMGIELAWIFCRVLGAVLIVPVCEELAFRGFIQPKFESVLRATLNSMISAFSSASENLGSSASKNSPKCHQNVEKNHITGSNERSPIFATWQDTLAVIASLILTALLFGALHSNLLAGSIAGLLYGLIYLRRRKVVDAIFAHAITNLLLAIYVIELGYWSYW